MSRKFYLLLLLLCLLVSIFLYQSSLDYFFFQDDFFEINISQAKKLGEYLEFFKFRDDIIDYRPISQLNYFFFSSSIFDLNPIYFRIIIFIVFLTNSLLISKVISKITKNQNIGLLSASLWITSAIHFMALTWISAAYNLFGTFFWLVTSIFFLNFINTNKFIFYILSLFFYLLTVGSFEFSITWPIIFGFYYFYVLKKPFFITIKLFLPFILISFAYLLLRVLLIKIPQIPEYQTSFNLESIKALFWYFLWTLSIPEEFKKQIVNNLLIFNPKFASEYWLLITKTFLGAFLIFLLGIILPAIHIAKSNLKPNFRLLIFPLVWFLVAISPVLLLPNHAFSMYLTLASIGLYFLIAYLINSLGSNILTFLIIIIWLYTSGTTLSFYKINSWMIESQEFTRKFAETIKKQHPYLPPSSIVYFPHQDHRHEQALMGHHAIRTIYNDQTLSIYYNKESLVNSLKEGKNRPVYIYVPE